MKFGIPPGVFDIVPCDEKEPWCSSFIWNHVEKAIREIVTCYGFQEIRTPIFERTELFQRSVGEATDIVSKEMYTFEDKGGRSMSLRPEGTAPVMRSLIENNVCNHSPIQKLFYIGPMFRYERSQAGRFRQHHQFGAEATGIREPEQDVEMIDLLYTLYNRLNLKNLSILINSIGDHACRVEYKKALQGYLQRSFNDLSSESKTRFETNPLRILDSKDLKDQEIMAQAPSILDHLNSESRDHFESVKRLLNNLKIPYQVKSQLVRGLDYYNTTVFEIVAGELGAQNSIGGGGRYDGLMKTLGGPDIPAIGFGTGIERIIQTMLKQGVSLPSHYKPTLFIIPLGEEAKTACFNIAHVLRQNGISTLMNYSSKKLNKLMQYANQIEAKFVVVIGEKELQTKEIEIKEMATGNIQKAELEHLVPILKSCTKTIIS